MDQATTHDVAILGSGIAGSTLATILAARGLSVLLLEAGSHPRFAVGESVVPEFGARARLLARTWNVPELDHLGCFQKLNRSVSVNSGVKRNFTFLSHVPGVDQDPRDVCQFQAMTYPIGPDSHIYRADLDSWLTSLAVRYGVDYHDRVKVTDLDIDPEGVTLHAGKRSWRVRFVVDGTGHNSLLARKFSLRKEPSCATNTRTIFTHMVGVSRIGEAMGSDRPLKVPSCPDQGTLHHLFEGGWFWVIPFDNHSGAVNPLCSVGLTLDRSVFPDNDRDPEEEFFEIVARFPTLARQLAQARSVRTWVKTGRLQYQSTHLAGERWCLMPHAAGFLDPLFSGGMTMTLFGVQEIATALTRAFQNGDPASASFTQMEERIRDWNEVLDRLVHGAYITFRHPPLFAAWFRIWAVSNFYSALGLIRLLFRHEETGDAEFLQQLDEAPYNGVLGSGSPCLRALQTEGYEILTRVASEKLTPERATDDLFQLLAQQDWIPPRFHITDRKRQDLGSFTVFPLLSIILWGKRSAPEEIRGHYYDMGPSFFRNLTSSLAQEAQRGLSSFLRVTRAAHHSGGRV